MPNMKWVSVKERLPEKDDYNKSGYVIVSRDDGKVCRDFYYNGHWVLSQRDAVVTHWMPFPPAAEGEE